MQFGNRVLGQSAELGCELDFAPPFSRGVKNRAALDVDPEHFFEAQRLSAHLRVIVIELPAFPFLVFNWAQRPRLFRFRIRNYLDNVALARQPEPLGPGRQRTPEQYALGHFVTGQIRVLMREIAEDRVHILLAPAFDGL